MGWVFPIPCPCSAELSIPCCRESAPLAVLQPGTFCKCLLVFGRAAAQTSLPSTWDFLAPGPDLFTSIEPHGVFPGPVLELSSVLLVEALPFGMPSHPPNLMSSVSQLSCSLTSLSRSLARCWLTWPQNWPLQGCPRCWLPAGQKPLISECPSSLAIKQFLAQLTPFIQAVFPFGRHEKRYPTQ